MRKEGDKSQKVERTNFALVDGFRTETDDPLEFHTQTTYVARDGMSIDISRSVSNIVTDAGQLLLHVGQLLDILAQQETAPVFLNIITGDPLPDGPRIDNDKTKGKLKTPFLSLDAKGIKTPAGIIFGPTFRFYFHRSSSDCNEFAVVQVSKLKHEKLDADGKTWNEQSDSHDWRVDGATSGTNPTNSTCTRPELALPGANIFKDTPGTPPNPWDKAGGKGTHRFVHDFETYIYCVDPAPQKLLGYFSWGYTMTVVVGDDSDDTSSKFSESKEEAARNKPTWHKGIDKGHLKGALEKWNKDEAAKWLKV